MTSLLLLSTIAEGLPPYLAQFPRLVSNCHRYYTHCTRQVRLYVIAFIYDDVNATKLFHMRTTDVRVCSILHILTNLSLCSDRAVFNGKLLKLREGRIHKHGASGMAC